MIYSVRAISSPDRLSCIRCEYRLPSTSIPILRKLGEVSTDSWVFGMIVKHIPAKTTATTRTSTYRSDCPVDLPLFWSWLKVHPWSSYRQCPYINTFRQSVSLFSARHPVQHRCITTNLVQHPPAVDSPRPFGLGEPTWRRTSLFWYRVVAMIATR